MSRVVACAHFHFITNSSISIINIPEMSNVTECFLIKYYVLSMPCESTIVVVR